MKGFAGFPDGKLRLTAVPNLFFSDLLPIIDHLAELKVTLSAFWALTQKEEKCAIYARPISCWTNN